MIALNVDGMEGVAVRDNLWGTFWIVKGGQNVPEYMKRDDDEFGPYAVYVKQWIVPDGSPSRFKILAEPIVRLIMCGPRWRAEVVQKFEATKYKQYRMVNYRGEDF